MIGLLPAENWEYRVSDIVRSFRIFLIPKKQSEKIYLEGIGDCIPVRSGRVAIAVALEALGLPEGARIAVPLYCCPVVFKAIKAAGCVPTFIDMDPETFCMSAEDLFLKRDQIDAIIAVHMFGNLCDVPALREAGRDKPIIEDCAQSLGSKINGQRAGSFGEIAAFSFRSGKYLSVGEGGALFSNRADVNSKASKIISEMPTPSHLDEGVHVLKTYVRSKLRSKPLYGAIGYRLWQSYNKRVNFSSKTPIVLTQAYRSDLTITNYRLALIESNIERQRTNADFYLHDLNLDPAMLCSERAGIYYNRYLFPILLPTKRHRDLIADYLLKQQIGTIQPYQDIADVAATHYGYAGDCPVTERIARRLLVIPSYYSLKREDVQRIVRCVNDGWQEIRDQDFSESL